jgi:hypothetical protein
LIGGAGYKGEVAEVRAYYGNKSAGVNEFYRWQIKVIEVIKILEDDGWYLVRTKGSLGCAGF